MPTKHLIREFNPIKPIIVNGAEVYAVTLPVYDKGERIGVQTLYVCAHNGQSVLVPASKLNLAV